MHALLAAVIVALTAATAFAQAPADLIIPEEGTHTISAGMQEYRAITINKRGTLILQGGVVLSCERLISAEGAKVEYRPTNPAATSENIVIDTIDASGVRFLYVSANGMDAEDIKSVAGTGQRGRNGESPSFKDADGKSATGGGGGRAGTNGVAGGSAANVKLTLPNLKPGSLVRVHANGGNGGKGQNGGTGGRGGNGAKLHPPKDGGAGGRGGNGGSGGSAGKIILYLVVADDASEDQKQESLKTIRFETANSGGNPGSAGLGGAGGAGGGGTGPNGSKGSRGRAGDEGNPGADGKSNPNERWTVFDVVTLGEYAKEYTKNLQKIRASLERH